MEAERSRVPAGQPPQGDELSSPLSRIAEDLSWHGLAARGRSCGLSTLERVLTGSDDDRAVLEAAKTVLDRLGYPAVTKGERKVELGGNA